MSSTFTSAEHIEQREAHDDEIPASARRLMRLAADHGWTAQAYYSRGVRYGAKTSSDNLTVRLTQGAKRLVGLGVDGAWRTGLVAYAGRQQLITLKSRDLLEAVRNV